MRTRWMPQPRMEQYETIKIRIERLKILRFVHGVVVLCEGRDFCEVGDSIFDHSTKGVAWSAFGDGLGGAGSGHGFGADKDEVNAAAVEEEFELNPAGAGKRGFGPGAEDEDADGRGARADILDGAVGAVTGGVHCVAKRYHSSGWG